MKTPPPTGMPPLTLDGKRTIAENALRRMGEKNFLKWLNSKDIPTLRHFQENIRKYKMKFFRELFELSL
jgi:hypothetical protein